MIVMLLTHGKYDDTNVCCVKYLFDSPNLHPNLLEHDIFEQITADHAVDRICRTKSGRLSKMRCLVNQVMDESLSEICSDDAVTHPIKLD